MQKLETGEIIMVIVGLLAGLAFVGAGIVRFVHRGHFSLMQAVYCLLSAFAALLLLAVASYTLQHARVALVMIVAILLLLVASSPAFCVGLGLTLMGMLISHLGD